jgi:ABC-type multidrug transport system ATPase subunit
MDEASLCDRIALMQMGKILSIDTPANISAAYQEKLYRLKTNKMHVLSNDLRNYNNIKSNNAFGEYQHISFVHEDGLAHHELRNYLSSKGHKEFEIEETIPTVEDCFIKLLKK